jgi:hypothetical protein
MEVQRHYQRFIADTYKNRFGEECTLEINSEFIYTKDKSSEQRINTSEVEAINEIKDFYFIKLKMGGAVIISKLKNWSGGTQTNRSGLKELVDKKGVPHNKELDWKWR